MNSSRVERLHGKLMALYDERKEISTDISLGMSKSEDGRDLDEMLHDLNHSIREIEKQLREAEGENLSYMREAI